MPTKYILIIIGASLFGLLVIINIIVTVQRNKREELRKREIEKMYADKNLATMDYDCAVYDEETEKLIRSKQMSDGQLTIEDVMKASPDGKVFQTVEKEGLEEITGNYKPEK